MGHLPGVMDCEEVMVRHRQRVRQGGLNGEGADQQPSRNRRPIYRVSGLVQRLGVERPALARSTG
jgi:hypothetical protein